MSRLLTVVLDDGTAFDTMCDAPAMQEYIDRHPISVTERRNGMVAIAVKATVIMDALED